MQIKAVASECRVVAQVLCGICTERVIFGRGTAFLLRRFCDWCNIFLDVDGVGFGFYRNVDRVANDLLHVNGVASGAGINCRNAKK